ncbi:hypothetical protein [Cryptosporangium japonicum]|uniref:Uncharacterized protein n=1 Tax=Cryptosporangium japonicum TaxID=80872 RepID=A0ABP3DLF1_9ACTN
MFSLTEDFMKAQYDYTRERLGTGAPRIDVEERPRRHRAGVFTLLFARHRLQPTAPD